MGSSGTANSFTRREARAKFLPRCLWRFRARTNSIWRRSSRRTSGNDFLAFGMSARGRRFGVLLDTGGNLGRWAGVSDVNGAFTIGNPTMRKGPWLTNGRRHTLRCEVRALGIRAWLDDREVANYRDGYECCSANPLGLPTWTQFFLHTNDDCAVVVHKLILTPSPPSSEYTNTLGMKFKLIPAGKFTMGSSQEEIDRCLKQMQEDDGARHRIPSEGPEHEVEITQPFYMGTTEVTVGQFRQFVDEVGYPVGDPRWKLPGFDQTDEHPVVWVSWNNAVDFCTWLSKKERKKYRLPTEAEWEYSCRAGKSGTRYFSGVDEAHLGEYAWYHKNSGGRTHPVGKKKPNDWGLYDMHGNAWEWCKDWYDADYYRKSPVLDPPGGESDHHVLRGGAWADGPVRAALLIAATCLPVTVTVTMAFVSCWTSRLPPGSGPRAGRRTKPQRGRSLRLPTPTSSASPPCRPISRSRKCARS